jgi:hypothetical protein
MSWLSGLVSKALGVAQKAAPAAHVDVKIAGQTATISAATLQAGLSALGKIPWAEIERQFNAGQVVTAGEMLADDAVSVIDKFIPAAIPAEKVLDFAVFVGTHSIAHNSGEGGIGRRPEGEGLGL